MGKDKFLHDLARVDTMSINYNPHSMVDDVMRYIVDHIRNTIYNSQDYNNSHFDPYVGVFPGYAVGQLNEKVVALSGLEPQSSNPVVLSPLISFAGGFNYYANRFFSLFINAQYVIGTHLSDVAPVSLNELKVSLGLGYHIWATKKHIGFRKPGHQKRY